MKKSYVLLIMAFIATTLSAEAQLWDKLKKKAEEKLEEALTKKTKTEKGKDADKKSKPSDSQEEDGQERTVSIDSKTKKTEVAVWRNYKFIPGEKVIFYDNLKQEEVGEFPSRWDLRKGGAEVATFDGEKVIIGTADYDNTILPLFDNTDYLSDEFTIEFDVFVDDLSQENNNSWVNYNMFFVKKELESSANSPELKLEFRSGKTSGRVCKNDFQLESVSLGVLNTWHHIALSYHKGKFKLYYDEKRIANLPKLPVTPDIFAIELEAVTGHGFKDGKMNYAIKNIRIAHGGGQMYKRMIAEGKYSTNGILFDSGKAIIKAQSMGIVNKVAGVMKEYSDWEFLIIGHTDADGSEVSNLALSKKRAEAIKAAIIAKGIDAKRITTLGKGESEPITNNTTQEGKANNRRVEFVKQ